MEVNKNIYPDVTENENFTYSNFLVNYSSGLNDMSCVYSSSTSSYAIKSEGIIAGRYTSPKTNLFFPVSNRSGQNFLMVNIGSGAGSYPANSYTNIVENSFNPFNDTHDIYSKIQLVTGFKYYSVIAVPYIVYTGSSNTVSLTPAKTYFDSYSNRKILGLAIRLYAGTNRNRSQSTSLTLVNTFNYTPALLKKVTDEGAENDKYAIDSTLDVQMLNAHQSNGAITQMIGCVNYPYSSFKIGTVTGHPFLNINSPFVNINNKVTADWSGSFGGIIPEITLTLNDVLHICATTGLIFTDDTAIASNLDLTNDDNIENESLYFPVKTGDLWQGDFVHGSANKNTEQYKNDWNSNKNSPFTQGSKPITSDSDENIYSDGETLNYTTPASTFTNLYKVTASNLKSLVEWLNPSDDDIFNGILDGLKFGGSNPLNCITSIMHIPVNVPTSASENIVIGKCTTDISCAKISQTTFQIDGGSTQKIYAHNKNWLDYEPYTQYVAWIPYCGWIELSANVITNKVLKFVYEIDVITGCCTCRILVNGVQYKTINGNMGTTFSVQAEDTKGYTNSILSAIGQMAAGTGGVIAGAVMSETGIGATAGIPTAIASFGLAAKGFYNFVVPTENFESIGTMTGNTGSFCPRKVNIYRLFTPTNEPENYGDTIGYACSFTAKISELSGFAVCADFNTNGINATETEKNMIKSIMNTGFFA